MVNCEKANYRYFRILVSVVVVIIITCTSSVVYAFNSDYIGDQTAWYDNGCVVFSLEDKNMNGACSYKIDNDDGCFYMFLHYDINDYPDKDKIEIGFEVTNSKNTYKFSVDKDGFSKSSSQNSMENIYLEQKFDNKGRVFIGFKLLNSSDRVLDSNVRCEFASGNENTITLFDNAVIEMFVPTTTRPLSTKNSTTKTSSSNTSKKTASSSGSSNKSNSTESSTKISTEAQISTTKFKPSGIVTTEKSSSKTSAKKNDSTKFQGSYQQQDNAETATTQTKTTESNFFNMLESSEENEADSGKKYERTKQSKIAIAFAFIIFVIGIFLLIFAVSNKGKKEKENRNTDR